MLRGGKDSMKKMVYKKPKMLVEKFVATQSVAANCGTGIVDMDPVTVGKGDHICDQPTCGHNVQEEAIKMFDKCTFDETQGKLLQDSEPDDKITIFNGSGECEVIYDNYVGPDAKKNGVVALGNALTGTGSWNSDTHKMKIGTVQIPS